MAFKRLEKLLRFGEAKQIKDLEMLVEAVGSHEAAISPLSDAELAAKTHAFKTRLEAGETLDDIMPEAFAVVREAARRVLDMRHFDVQIMGGIVLHQGKIAEMKTGEGKTLVATLPVYLNALGGAGVHIVTVNDYLAKRDVQWMGPLYHFLGLKVSVLQHDSAFLLDPSFENPDESLELLRPIYRDEAYQADITCGTNSEFGFDYLRDNMATSLEEKVQRSHDFAIVDEVDSILIDEARTPLIISGAPEQAAQTYRQFARLVPGLKKGEDYEVDEKTQTVSIKEAGVARVEAELNVENLYDFANTGLVHHLNQALRAHALFKNDKDYIVKDGEVIIVDEFTGRLMEGRRYSEGLHQAIEAKENVPVKEENQTLATITIQNYFRLYDKLAGMTGTAATEADEFLHTYQLETVIIPPNRPLVREDLADLIYRNEEAKFNAVIEDIAERHANGQPVLVGTISIEKSEVLSRLLSKRGVKHEVLNAKQHEREAHIIEGAGQRGAVTIATNMAGRGVDIILGDGVADIGGLHVLGTERHEARRIDNQLRGRAGRQGDQGSTRFYISLEDDLMRLFARDRIAGLMERMNFPDDVPIEHPLINRAIETAQKQVEQQNFGIRKHVLEYDDVMNTQRSLIYDERDEILDGLDIRKHVDEAIEEIITGSVAMFVNRDIHPDEWDMAGLFTYMEQLYPVSLGPDDVDPLTEAPEGITVKFLEDAHAAYAKKEEEIGADMMRRLERIIMLSVIDNHWREHLYEMDYLREGIGLRAIGQRDPLVEYKNEGFRIFAAMVDSVKDDFVRLVFHVEVSEAEPVEARQPVLRAVAESGPSLDSPEPEQRRKASPPPGSSAPRIGRNDPCPCGSGKKYKKCCGA